MGVLKEEVELSKINQNYLDDVQMHYFQRRYIFYKIKYILTCKGSSYLPK